MNFSGLQVALIFVSCNVLSFSGGYVMALIWAERLYRGDVR